MSKNPPLNLIIRVSAERRDTASLSLAGSRRQTDEATRKLAMLNQYRRDYLGRMNSTNSVGNTDPVRMSNIRAFLDKLDNAVIQQQHEVQACESYVNACFHLLNVQEKKLKSLEMLRDQRACESDHRERCRDQKRNDEYAARAARTGGATLDFRPT